MGTFNVTLSNEIASKTSLVISKGSVCLTSTSFRCIHPEKQKSSRFCKEEGNCNLRKEALLEKAYLDNIEIVSGNNRLFIFPQFAKAYSDILHTPFGHSILDKLVQF